MRRIKFSLLFFIFVLSLFIPCKTAKAGSIYTSPFVKFSPDGKAWTVEQSLSGYDLAGRPLFWYRPEAANFRTGITSSLRQLKTGQHYYKYDRKGIVPIGQWRVEHVNARCVHESIHGGNGEATEQNYHGLEWNAKCCGQPYYSGWVAYCADCGESMISFIYMSEEAVHTITELPMGVDHYYLCPHCSHLEQGVGLTHRCAAVSYNRYKVEYEKNADDVGGYMSDSLHMYDNAEMFEGRQVTPVKRLSLNSYFRTGCRFLGWNTKADGTGDFYADGEEIFNLTDENYDEAARKGIIILYAQWERIESNLVFDAAGGRYDGENPMRRGCGEILYLDGRLVTPPKGCKVSFQTNGGGGISPLESSRSFERWDIMPPMHGSLTGNSYCFPGEMDVTDTAVAVYRFESIELPTPEKSNFSFGGWYADEELTRLVGYGGDSYTPDSDVTLYAMWVELRLYSEDNYTDYEGKGAVDLSWQQSDNIDKVYRLYQSENGGADYTQISDVLMSVGQEPDLETVFLYEGSGGAEPRTFIVPSSGLYTLTANGAQGGNFEGFLGGLGGKISGKFFLTKGEVLTITTGGRDGGNGGGRGTVYAGGGGMTQVLSDRRGLLLTAGGGGGASEAGAGQPGGAGSGLVPEGNAGENGMSGGGGGYLGGTAGEHITHQHTKECRIKYAEDYIAANKVAVTNTDRIDETMGVYYKKCRTGLIKTEGVKSVSVQFSWFNAWVEPALPQTTLKILDQNGRVLKEENADRVLNGSAFHNGASLNTLLRLCTEYSNYGSYEMWLKQFDAYTFSDLPAEFLIDVTPSEDGYPVCRIIAEPVTDGSRNWVHVRLTHSESGQIYENAAGRAYHPDGVRTKVTLDRHSSDLGGYDNWNDIYVDRYMDMKIECELDDGVSGIYVEGSAAVYALVMSLFTAKLDSVVLQMDRLVCGMEEGQVISAKPAYGGSSFVNTDCAISWDMAAGCVEGDGSVEIRAEMTSMAEGQELKAVKAHDTAAPSAVAGEKISKTPLDESHVLVSFYPVEDNGTEYFFRAESYSIRTGGLISISNVVSNMLKTGLDGYLYLLDRNPDTLMTAYDAADGQKLLREERIVVGLEDFAQYLHLAAVDRAGNVSDTVHVLISREDKELYWQPYTELLNADSTVGGRNHNNLYPAENDRTYYVKADGVTPFLLSFDSYMEGAARDDYQINYQILDISFSDGGGSVTQRHIAGLPYAEPPEADMTMDGRDFIRRTAGQAIFQDALYSGASRSEQGSRVNFYQAFTVEKEFSGRVIRVVPVAGVSTPDGVLYSRWEEDVRNGLWLVADGAGPVITGLEALQSVELIDRTKESVVVEAVAADELSGIREFYLQIENLNNFSKEIYPADENGIVRVEITRSTPLFSGDILVTAHAEDNVGNETEQSWYVTEFALETKVERILEPHDPVFKRGESGILHITAWGYVDRVEVEFPDFLSEYSRVIDYGDLTDYRCDEQVEFMIPLYALEDSYEITVRAYKGDRRLEDRPVIRTIQVKESVLDEIRTRLRE